MNIGGEFRQALKSKPCRVFGSDQRLEVRRGTLYTYPDVQIVCGEVEYAAGDRGRNMITNPKVVFEVLSPSTEAYDRGDKFEHYIALPSLSEYVLVSQHQARVQTFHRREDGTWLFSRVEGLDGTLHVQSIDIGLSMSEIYRDVTFEPAPQRPGSGETIADGS